ETIIVSANDELVNLFLNKKISFINFQKILLNFVKLKEFTKLKKKKPKNIKEINNLNEYVRLKIKKLCI
ncbi:1-deoxy-D-xylulose-5-phosphate reductoisomerase, partial [Candidatus Pelagibacter sp.]|nr:1-deoxy-D-xylulose-5-phosphate reductoisomerase [Candidatus Pelagibacter sp.]